MCCCLPKRVMQSNISFVFWRCSDEILNGGCGKSLKCGRSFKSFNLGNSPKIKISRICPLICSQYFMLVRMNTFPTSQFYSKFSADGYYRTDTKTKHKKNDIVLFLLSSFRRSSSMYIKHSCKYMWPCNWLLMFIPLQLKARNPQWAVSVDVVKRFTQSP